MVFFIMIVIVEGTVSVYRQPVLNLASGTVVNCEFFSQSVGCYNHM